MTSPLETQIAAHINKALANVFLPATLTRTTRAAGANAWTPGAATVTNYACKAIHDEWHHSWITGGMIGADEVKLLILAGSLAVEPIVGDVVTIRSEAFTIVPGGSGKAPITTDPAKAAWVCRAKK
jgi:hypothetical protein